ncbi:unnamed protein product, partial [Nesidiocoris tenuis]
MTLVRIFCAKCISDNRKIIHQRSTLLSCVPELGSGTSAGGMKTPIGFRLVDSSCSFVISLF